jgi:hypothetical protein
LLECALRGSIRLAPSENAVRLVIVGDLGRHEDLLALIEAFDAREDGIL